MWVVCAAGPTAPGRAGQNELRLGDNLRKRQRGTVGLS